MGGEGDNWFGKFANCLVPIITFKGDPSWVFKLLRMFGTLSIFKILVGFV